MAPCCSINNKISTHWKMLLGYLNLDTLYFLTEKLFPLFHFFSSPDGAAAVVPPIFLFFALSFSFALLLSLFLSALIPPLHISAYLAKKDSSSSGCTMVDSFIFSARLSLPLLFVARIRSGIGASRARSGNWAARTSVRASLGASASEGEAIAMEELEAES